MSVATKTMLIVAIGVFLVALAVFGMKPGEATPTDGKVGTRPGGVKESLDITKTNLTNGHELALLASGCFWGVEERFRQIPGVVATAVGYSGGHTMRPTYQEVCGHKTGHAESVLIEFDPKRISYAELLDVFFKNHNPTTKDRQGPDIGDQYRSAIFYRDDEQKAVADRVIARFNKEKFQGKIVTEVTRATTFWMAEDYHQQYCAKNGIAACPIR